MPPLNSKLRDRDRNLAEKFAERGPRTGRPRSMYREIFKYGSSGQSLEIKWNIPFVREEPRRVDLIRESRAQRRERDKLEEKRQKILLGFARDSHLSLFEEREI
jgi:hypothetical protein